ncbi:MAG: hypothetical protein M1461_03895 [Nitrospirae bacterium]|nr:hypothetical protein [Nitrospirota bacterium]
MDINELANLAKQLKIDSLFLSKEELCDTLSSWPEYTSKQRLSIVWNAGKANFISVRAWDVSEKGYEDDSTLQVSLTHAYRLLIKNKLLKSALMNKYKIDDYDEIDFDYEDFTHPITVELLCRTIKDDFPQLDLSNDDNTLNILNQVLRTPNFFESATHFRSSIMSSKRIFDLSEKIASHATKSYEAIPEDDRRVLRRVNKYILEKLYPNKIPKKLPLDDIDAHHNVHLVDTFEKEQTLKSHIADVTWLGREANKIKIAIKNKSKKSIPFSSSDVRLVVDADSLLRCMDCYDCIPVGWFIGPSLDILKDMTVKAVFQCEGLNRESIIKRLIYRQNFYGRNGWYSCYSLFDFQIDEGK